jgi:hypothetical protein
LPGRAILRQITTVRQRGAYINFLTEDETDRVAFAYGKVYDRLVELKKKYDPTNFFRMNQNIRPA